MTVRYAVRLVTSEIVEWELARLFCMNEPLELFFSTPKCAWRS